MPESETRGERGEGGQRRCDFCGQPSPTVRRVALDRDYDRLQKPHPERYACPACSEAKDRQRRGLGRR